MRGCPGHVIESDISAFGASKGGLLQLLAILGRYLAVQGRRRLLDRHLAHDVGLKFIEVLRILALCRDARTRLKMLNDRVAEARGHRASLGQLLSHFEF